MKYLTDKEILKWNDRIKNSGFFVKPSYGNGTSYPNISINLRPASPTELNNNNYTHLNINSIIDPPTIYVFSFSVASNRVETFFDIHERIKKERFYTKILGKNDSLMDIKIDDKDIFNKDIINHKILDKEYTRFTYKFSGKLTSIMVHVAYLEDTIEFFRRIWGYDEDGKEHLLIKFPIGSIVSKIDDKSSDFLIFEYDYEKTTNAEYNINYNVCEMIKVGSIIKYEQSQICREDDLCFSRNNRIDDILS